MFAKFFALFALLAVAFAAPNPKPQVLAYTGVDYAGYYPATGVVPYSAYSPYSYSPYAYSAYSGVPSAVYLR